MNVRALSIPAMFCAAVATSAVAAPVQWSSNVGGNNHYYELFAPPQGATWTEARTAAVGSTFHGEIGHLVTISNVQEWNFIITQFPRDWTWIGLTDEVQEGNFQWVTGEPVTFTQWIPGEPNNAGDEDYVFYQRATALGGNFGWNDFQNFHNVYTSSLPLGYITEFDTVPEPSSGLLAFLALSVLAVFRLLRGKRARLN